MREKLFQFIWLFRHYNAHNLRTVDNLSVQVVHPGQWNHHQGPDFLHAKILVDDVLLVGSVELHIHSDEWYKHKHDKSLHFSNVILHVVYAFDGNDLPNVPTLVLGDRVASTLESRYNHLLDNEAYIPCDAHFKTVTPIVLRSWLDRLLAERLFEKKSNVEQLLQKQNYHWNHIAWQLMTATFAPGINTSVFEMIANIIPYTKLMREHTIPLRIEAVFLGVAGLLQGEFKDKYPIMLQREFDFLRKKYGLKVVNKQLSLLRLRPANFPSIRLSQLAQMFHLNPNLISRLLSIESLKDMKYFLQVDSNDYWNEHYRFDVPAKHLKKSLGKQMVLHLLINAVIPILYTYGKIEKRFDIIDRVQHWLNELPPETNKILTAFEEVGYTAGNAADAQALLQLKRKYCDEKRCLDCAIGASILKRYSAP